MLQEEGFLPEDEEVVSTFSVSLDLARTSWRSMSRTDAFLAGLVCSARGV